MALGIGATVTPRAGRVAPSRPGDHGGYPAVAPLVIYLTCIMKGIKIMRTIKQGFSRYVAGGLVAMLLVLLAAPMIALAAVGDINTVAGNGTEAFGGDGGPATNASLHYPSGLAFDSAGNLYIADGVNRRVRKVDTSGNISTVAGNGTAAFSGDGGPAINASLAFPLDVAVDSIGNLYIADVYSRRVRKVDTSGNISTVAGNGHSAFSGNSVPAISSGLNPYNVAIDHADNLYITDRDNQRILKVDTSGIISTVAGNGTQGSSGDGGLATNANLWYPGGMAFDSAGNLYFVDRGTYRIRKVATNGIISTVAGNGILASNGDGGLAINASLSHAEDVAFDGADKLYIAEAGGQHVRVVGADGIISTVAGAGNGFSGDGGPALNAYFRSPFSVAFDGAGNLYIADYYNNRIRMVTLPPLQPRLSIPNIAIDASNGNFSVPVNFNSAGKNISAVGFSIDYGESCLTFDATDANNDGIPDAITGLPSGFVASISHNVNDTGSELDISLFDSTAPMSALGDGALLTVAFTVKPACITSDGTTTDVTLNFASDPTPSFSDALATDVTGTSSGATIALQFNATPTAINLGNNSVAENAASGATIGTLSSVDPDSSDTHTYALVSGSGDTDNASFVLDGATLKTAASFDFETKSSYSIRLRTTDNGGLNGAFEQALTINVTNVNEAPVAVNDTVDPLTTVFVGGQATNITVLANDTDPENDPLSVGSVNTTGTQGSVTNNSTAVSYTAPNANGSSSFSYQAGDGSLSSSSATVNVTYVKNDPRGDCNANGSLTAADFVATILEIFDTNDTLYNSNPAWWLIYTGDFAGSPRGCDSNAGKNGSNNSSDSVSAGDIVCTVLLFFKGNCGASIVAAGQQTTAQLTVADASAQPGQTATVTVNFNPAGNQVAAASFALVIDPSQLGFDATDANGDGLPDAVQLTVPAGMSKSVQWNAAQNRLEVAVFGASLPLPTLGEGVLATVNLQVAATAAPGVTTLGVALASLGDTEGQDLAVAPTSGVLTIGDGAAARNLLYLPVAVR